MLTVRAKSSCIIERMQLQLGNVTGSCERITATRHQEATMRTLGMQRNDIVSLLFFLLLVVGGGLAMGVLTAPDDWYAQLEKPAFTPPGWVFAPVWTALYVAIAVAGWRVWKRDRGGRAMGLWWAQLVLNFLWSPIFFSAHLIVVALVVVLLLLTAVVGFIASSWWQDRLAAWLFLPYAAWVAFASLLNASIAVMN
jgi:translocator protein